MIVRKLDDGSLIMITQADHAKLSGEFAAHWGNAQFATPARRESTVRAAALHDAGWYRYETSPIYDAVNKTSPSFFQVPNDARQLEAYCWAIDWLTGIDPYAGLLISRHRTGLWRNRYGMVSSPASSIRGATDPAVEACAADLERRQEPALAEIDRGEFDINYQLLQFWDLFSLALCTREPREETFELVPTSYAQRAGEGVAMRMSPGGGTEIRIDPYPFDIRPLTVALSYRHLPTGDFADESAFRLAYFGAAPMARTFTFV